MFSCNVNAGVSLLEYYLTLSEYEKQMYLNICRLENYSKNTSTHAKGDVCHVAYTYTIDKLLNEAEKESIFSSKAQLLQAEGLLYLNKACLYYKLSNIKPKINMCKETYKRHYENTLKCNTYIHTRALCNIIKDNYMNY
jgi:hypothetical protein